MMRIITVTFASAVLLLLAACDTINLGHGGPGGGPSVGAITVPTGKVAGQSGDFSVSWTGGTAPYTVEWDFGGGANPDTVAPATATSPAAQTVTLNVAAGGTFTVTATVTDSGAETGTSTASYTYGASSNTAPVLSVKGGAASTSITIHGEDAESDDIVVTVTNPAGLSASAATKTITGGSGDVTFDFTAADLFNAASGVASFTGNDGIADSNTVTALVVSLGPVGGDTLFAIPLVATAGTADTVTIVVTTTAPASPFEYLNGCRVTAPTGFSYVDGTFNVGTPGGAAGDADGFWTGMAPSGGFLLPPDNFIVETDLGGGLVGIDFNVTPIGGANVSGTAGALFNFGAKFAVGDNTLGFQQTAGVDRTYYTDNNTSPNRYWGDITNNVTGVPNKVTAN